MKKKLPTRTRNLVFTVAMLTALLFSLLPTSHAASGFLTSTMPAFADRMDFLSNGYLSQGESLLHILHERVATPVATPQVNASMLPSAERNHVPKVSSDSSVMFIGNMDQFDEPTRPQEYYHSAALTTGVIATIPVGSSPHGIAVNANTNRIYVANGNSNNVSVIDGSTHSVMTTVAVGSHPYWQIAVNPRMNRVYVSNNGNSSVSVIDGEMNSVIATISGLGGTPEGVGVHAMRNLIYVTHSGSTLSVINGATNQISTTVDTGRWNHLIVVNPNTDRAYVSKSDPGVIAVIDLATNQKIADVNVNSNPWGIDVNPITNRVYVANYSTNTVSVIDGTTNSVIAAIGVGVNPSDVAVNPNTDCSYIANAGSDTVSIIDNTTNTVMGTVSVGSRPDGIAVNPTTGLIYVTNRSSNTVSVILDTTCGLMPTPVPASPASLRLSAAASYNSTRPIAPGVGVENFTSLANAYTVTVSLLQNGSPLATQSQNVTVAAGGSVTLGGFDFGVQPTGIYTLRAELRSGNTLLDSAGPLSLQVVLPASSSAQQRAIQEGAKLQTAAKAELDDMAGIVANRYQDSLSTAASEAVGFVTGKLVKWLKPVGQASGKFSADDINAAIGHVAGKLTGVGAAWAASGGISGWSQETAEGAVYSQRQAVRQQQDAFDAFVVGRGSFTWTTGMGQVIQTYRDAIRSRVESEVIPGVLPPPLIIGPTTLKFEDQTYGLYQWLHQVLGILVVVGTVIIIVLAGLAAIGLSVHSLGASIAAYVAALPGLVGTLSGVKHAVAAALVILAIVLHLQTEVWVAPAVTHYHDRGLDALSTNIQNATGMSFAGLSTTPAVHGREVTLDTHLANQGVKAAQPLVETYIYSVDGRVVDILSQQPQIGPGESTRFRGSLHLFPGRYRAVTAVHTRERIGLASAASTFDVPSPQLDLSVEMPQTQLNLGEVVQATIHITNSDTITNTGDVGILAVANDNVHSQGWLVNLGPGESRTLPYEFTPQEAGSYRLRVTATDGSQLLALQDAGYVVGSGAAIVLAPDVRDVYSPTLTVTIPIDAVNSGNVATTTVLSLVTFDRLHNATPVYTDTHTLSLGPGATTSLTAVALPASQAQPGLYAARLFLGGALYSTSDFAVAAEDTLFADVYPDTYFHNVGDTVPLTTTVMNSLFAYADGDITATLWRPDGVTNTVTMNPIDTGQYEGTVTASITGTYQVSVNVSRPNYRGVGNTTFFAAGTQSTLSPTVTGQPLLGETHPVTITVHNEMGTPLAGVSVAASHPGENLVTMTDEAGQAVLMLSPVITQTYRVTLEMPGFAETETGIPVWIGTDTTPPAVSLNTPAITNQTPLTVTGYTEAGASVAVNGDAMSVDAGGRFTTTLSLLEGENVVDISASDTASNTTTITHTVTLDTVPPALTITYPPDGLIAAQDVISVTGSSEMGASLTVSGTLATVDPASGVFSAWVLLRPGANRVPVTAADEAGNSTTITRTVTYACALDDFDGNGTVNAADIQAVAAHWRQHSGDAGWDARFDLNNDGIVNVLDVLKVSAQLGQTCP